ncbi:MAG: PKD domain-containing protein [Bacteroidales bacterium]
MKRIIYIALFIPAFLVSCEIVPDARFSVDTSEPEVGQEVFFTNRSFNAETFEWDFGDGYVTDEPDPAHVYTASGDFQVKLTAYSKTGLSDDSYMTIKVRIPTLLEIEVQEYYDKYPVKNASVRLYATLSDWDAQRNIVNEGFTDANGIVVFSGLSNKVYYVDVWETSHNNYSLRDEDPGFIMTDQLKSHQINRFLAYVDYTGTKGSVMWDRSAKVKSASKRISVK